MNLEIIKDGDVLTGILKGRLDTLAAMQFSKDMNPLMENADKHIILDCTDLEFISSSGLRCLLALRKKTMVEGGDAIIKGANDEIMQVFKITGFTQLFKFE